MNYPNPNPYLTHPGGQPASLTGPPPSGMYMGQPGPIPGGNMQNPNMASMNMVNPPDMAMLARQGYLQQQQQLAAMTGYAPASVGSGGGTPGPGPMSMRPGAPMPQYYAMNPQAQVQAQQQHQELFHRQMQVQAQQHAAAAQAAASGSGKKKRGPKPSVGAQMIARQSSNFEPPHSTDHYVKNALAPPPHPSTVGASPNAGPGEVIEPWADSLDELDPRELAMGRFRRRHEVLGEVFGPESIKDIPSGEYDPWEGLGMDGETLEAKVLALEQENVELEGKLESEVDAFRRRLREIDAGVESAQVPIAA
ncbi:hypothetical protein IAU60_005268 [Kwoniella sp. DSM 27419]